MHVVNTITFPDLENVGQIFIWIWFMLQEECSTFIKCKANFIQMLTDFRTFTGLWVISEYKKKKSKTKNWTTALQSSPLLASSPLVIECPNNWRDTVFWGLQSKSLREEGHSISTLHTISSILESCQHPWLPRCFSALVWLLLLFHVQEDYAEDKESCHHGEDAGVVWVGWGDEALVLSVLQGTHGYLW